MSDLTRRALTVAVGIPLAIGWLWLAHALSSFWLLALPLAGLVGVAAWEYAGLAHAMDCPLDRWIFAAVSGASLVAYGALGNPLATIGVLAGGMALVGLAQVGQPHPIQSGLTGAVGLVYLPFLASFLVPFVNSPSIVGLKLVLTLLALVWSYDSGAYLVGSRWGRHRMAPTLSPKKSWEGVAGGGLAALAVGLLSMIWLPWGLHGLAIAMVVSAAAQVGDLFASWLKRMAGVKDTGTLFPGHGGVLDRIDALLFALPAFHTYLVMVAGWAPL